MQKMKCIQGIRGGGNYPYCPVAFKFGFSKLLACIW